MLLFSFLSKKSFFVYLFNYFFAINFKAIQIHTFSLRARTSKRISLDLITSNFIKYVDATSLKNYSMNRLKKKIISKGLRFII